MKNHDFEIEKASWKLESHDQCRLFDLFYNKTYSAKSIMKIILN